MDLHVSEFEGRIAFLFIDDDERVVELPTDFMRSLCRSARNYPDGTLRRYAEKTRDLCAFLERHDVYGRLAVDSALRVLKRPALDAFYRSLQAQAQEEATVRLAEAAVRRFTTWLNSDEAGYAHPLPLYPEGSKPLTPTPSKRLPKYLTHEQVVNLILKLHYEAQRLVLHFIYETGVRISEVARVLKSDLPDWSHYPDAQMYFPLLIRGSKGRGKQLKQRYVIVSRPMLYRIAKYHNTADYQFNHIVPKEEKPVFLNTLGEPWTEDSIEAFIRKARIRSGILKASAHMLRHGMSYSILRSEHGKSMLDNLVILQRLLGHSKIETTEIYTDIPAHLLQSIASAHKSKDFAYRFEETQDIFDRTYLPTKRQPPVRAIGRQRK